MAVAHVASAASGSTNPTTSMTITIPTVSTGDVLIVAATSRDHTAATAFPTCTDNDTGGETWKLFHYSADRKALMWFKRATGSTSAKTITVAGAVGSVSGGVSAYSGIATTILPYMDLHQQSNASGTETHTGWTTTANNGELVFVVFNYANDNAVTSVSAATAGAFTSRWEKLSTGGLDCGTTLWSQPEATAGATGNITWAQTNGTTYSTAFLLVATEPEAVAFPSAGVRDAFTRADENPITGGWSANPVWSGSNTARVVSNQMAARGTDAHPFWDTVDNADCEAYCEFLDSGIGATGSMEVAVRGTSFNTASPQYYFAGYYYSRSTIEWQSFVGGGDFKASYPTSFGDGDALGVRCVGARITGWYKASGGSWTKVFAVLHSTLSAGGRSGLVVGGTTSGTAFADNFGGGNYTVANNYTLTAEAGTFSYSGGTTGLLRGLRLPADAGTFSYAGGDAGLARGFKVIAETGTFDYAGGDAAFSRTWAMPAASGSFPYSGADAGLLRGYTLTADAGSFAYSGNDVAFVRGFYINAETGTFSYSGADAGLLRAWVLPAEAGSFTYSGGDALTFKGWNLAAESGSFTYTGNDVAFLRGVGLLADGGSFTYTGADAILARGLRVVAETGTFTYTGNDASFIHGQPGQYTIAANTGTFTYTGSDAALTAARILSAESGTFAYSGNDAGLYRGYNLAADGGSFTYTGQDAALLWMRALAAEAGVFTYSGADVILTVFGQSDVIHAPTGFHVLPTATGILIRAHATGILVTAIRGGIDIEEQANSIDVELERTSITVAGGG